MNRDGAGKDKGVSTDLPPRISEIVIQFKILIGLGCPTKVWELESKRNRKGKHDVSVSSVALSIIQPLATCLPNRVLDDSLYH